MSDYEKSADFTSQAARLNLLEEKVRNNKPGDASPDARIYKLTLDGSVTESENADWSKNVMVFENMPSTSPNKSLFASIYGPQFAQGYFNIRVATVPFYNPIFGTAAYNQFLDDDTSMASVLLPLSGAAWVADVKARFQSAWQAIFGYDEAAYQESMPNSVDGNKSLAARILALEAAFVAEVTERQAEIANLQQQINNLSGS